jgi:hypothetical protein
MLLPLFVAHSIIRRSNFLRIRLATTSFTTEYAEVMYSIALAFPLDEAEVRRANQGWTCVPVYTIVLPPAPSAPPDLFRRPLRVVPTRCAY